MKTISKSIYKILLFSFIFISCSESENNEEVEIKIEFRTFEAENNLDIKVIATKIEGSYTQIDEHSGAELHLGSNIGTTEFCIKLVTDENSEGITTCKTFKRTQEEVDKANKL
ncbi:hypothetical protein [Wenyingzhuangia sp. 2_MG-2023]|uniref:hypothetical protein n=1 Tax=Wenyingzhuangia sp. 2_MG-2023 TaxID=3062639 RepID=UPI0026E26118|nr:hypothetical protein [Wenyingzhuangia sp. 2_MG-2023]MDO6736690.1 hypothetical protein [Wenyingzhuangia sp. 2_MG-2023]